MIGKKPFVLSLSKDARIVPFDSPFVLRFSKDESREVRDSGQDSVTFFV